MGLLSVSFGDPAESVTVRARSRSNPEIVSEDMVVPLIDESTEHGPAFPARSPRKAWSCLKNDNEALPLKPETTVALLGIGQAELRQGRQRFWRRGVPVCPHHPRGIAGQGGKQQDPPL